MRIALLIQAHKDAAQINRLIQALAAEEIAAYVHLDRKSSVAPSQLDARAKLIEPRVDVRWGDFSQIQASLAALAAIERDGGYDYLIFISGQDYPVWSTAKIVDFFANAKGKQFLHHSPLAPAGWLSAAGRVEYFHYGGTSVVFRAAYAALRAGMRTLSLKRRMVGGLKPYGGSQWFMLTRECVAYILKYVREHPEYAAFMRSVSCVDEIFYHTLLLNSKFQERIVNSNYHYIDWSDCHKGLSSNPNWLTESDFDKIAASGSMFCRKIDGEKGAALMGLLDERRK